MGRWGRDRRPGPALDAAIGAASGLAASWLMSAAYRPIWRMGSEETRRREQAAQAGLPPATIQAADAATVGRLFRFSRPPTRYPASTHAKGLAAHLVYGVATDAGWRLARNAVR